MTFSDIVGTILNFCGQGGGGEFETFVKGLVNQKYQEVLDQGEVPNEQRTFVLTTVAGTKQYGLPLYVARVLGIEDPTTPRFIFQANARFYEKNLPGATESGTPTMAWSLGTRGVQKQPGTAGVLSVVSSSALDTGSNYKVRLTGFSTGGVLQTEQVTLAGATPVSSAAGFTTTNGVERLVKEAATGYAFSGVVTVKDAGSITLAEIPLGWDSPSYQWIEFYPTPSAAISYNIRSEMRKPILVNDGDWPELDASYHMLLVFGVTQDLLPGLGKATLGDRHRASYQALEDRMKRSANRKDGTLRTFSDIQVIGRLRNRPAAPQIQGVDFGLVE